MAKPTLAVWKLTSCDGCQLSLLDCEDELLELCNIIDIAHFLEATKLSKPGPYDLSLVEGSISTPDQIQHIQMIREQSKYLVCIGACATSGGIQALRNFADVNEYINIVYAKPEYIKTLTTSRAISEYVKVDFELRGCPINKEQLLEVCKSFLLNKKPNIPATSVCMECKRQGNPCIMVTQGTPCLGPITHAGCGALCPSYHRGCYGCYGPKETPNVKAFSDWLTHQQVPPKTILRLLRNFNADAEAFKQVSKDYDQG